MVKVGTFNIYWFGAPDPDKFQHAPEDDARLAAVIRALAVDLIGFIEIVDVARFETLLAMVGPTWRIRDAGGQTLTSKPGSQHLVLAWSSDTIEVMEWQRLVVGNRSPLIARVKEVATGKELVAVLAHPKSSAFTDPDGVAQRRATFDAIVAFLADPPPAFENLPAFVFGDLNSLAGSPEQAPLVAQPGWRVLPPTVTPDDAGLWTTNLDKQVIDHFVVSPAVTVTHGPEIIAYDRDPSVDDPGGSTNDVMKRLSDHRPVRVTFAL